MHEALSTIASHRARPLLFFLPQFPFPAHLPLLPASVIRRIKADAALADLLASETMRAVSGLPPGAFPFAGPWVRGLTFLVLLPLLLPLLRPLPLCLGELGFVEAIAAGVRPDAAAAVSPAALVFRRLCCLRLSGTTVSGDLVLLFVLLSSVVRCGATPFNSLLPLVARSPPGI